MVVTSAGGTQTGRWVRLQLLARAPCSYERVHRGGNRACGCAQAPRWPPLSWTRTLPRNVRHPYFDGRRIVPAQPSAARDNFALAQSKRLVLREERTFLEV